MQLHILNDCMLWSSGGTLLGGIAGLIFRVLLGRQAWLSLALSCSVAIATMEFTALQYPPGIWCKLMCAMHALCLTCLMPELCNTALIDKLHCP